MDFSLYLIIFEYESCETLVNCQRWLYNGGCGFIFEISSKWQKNELKVHFFIYVAIKLPFYTFSCFTKCDLKI